jgi:class 3 adenylate cyclase/PAS domain-containing protein
MSGMNAALAARFLPRAEEYREYIDGESSILNLRTTELEQLRHMETLLAQNVDYSNRLTGAVNSLVRVAASEVQAATDEALTLQRASTLVIIAVVALSLICSVLIVWLYVGRNLIRRLTGLSGSMMAIAEGDLKVEIPEGGSDELADMADALLVFRDTAVEVRETNLREIQEARTRLTDAIESIGEGFALYDSEDRLVLCNSRYREILYPGVRDILVAGTPFETVLRTAAGRGLIKEAQTRQEEWIEERLERHRDASEPHLQQQSDGRWIQISEYRTESGGTVGVYTEVTELIDQAEQLETWNKELENRVAGQVRELQKVDQLRRFFPPQLADAIVSDDKSGVLEDHRREVTVIFCDLRGFTAFSSMAEPEEEMRILREYHAVVCPLIFEYGATLEHFAGDGVMSFLNDPVQHPDHIRRAIEMADAMRAGMRILRKEWLKREIDMGFGVGIGTGYATLGRIGTRDLFHYAAIGSVANLCARLCDEAKDGQILVPQRVYSDIEGDFEVEPVGLLKLKGFPKPVAAYNIIGPLSSSRS